MSIQIHATLGPASFSPGQIEDLILAGADVLRLNLSHCRPDDLPHWVNLIRQISRSVGRTVNIAADIRGRKLRLGPLAAEPVLLTTSQAIVLHGVSDGQELIGDQHAVWVNHPLLATSVVPGQVILLDDGALRLRVTHIQDHEVTCRVEVGGPLPGRSGLNLPGAPSDLPAISPKDRTDLDVIARLGVDSVYLSYVESGQDIALLRHALEERGSLASIIAKVERSAALPCLGDIAAAADAVCLARGDLGVEIPLADIPFVQRQAVARTHAAHKPFILAGEVLYSMVSRQIPARAELTDVAIALEQGVDGFILSDETAVGIAPGVAVRTLVSLIAGMTRHLAR